MFSYSSCRYIAALSFLAISLHALVSDAAIAPTGDVDPVYSGAEPWNVGESLTVGRSGVGSLQIDDASLVNHISYNGYIARNSGSQGTAIVTGAGSRWHTSDLYVGDRGAGVLTIEDGGVVRTTANGYIGDNSSAHGTANVTGAGSQWYDIYRLYVGKSGTGILNIQDGGYVRSGEGYVGDESGAIGTVTVTGAGSRWDVGTLFAGDNGSGVVNIEAGGVVEVNNNAYTGRIPSSYGEIHLDGGTLNAAGVLASPGELTGVGTINTGTFISDVNLIFNQTTGLQQQVTLNSLPGQNITVNIDATIPNDNGSLGAGYRGVGSLQFADGLAIESDYGVLGYHMGSSGTATFTGSGTNWDNNQYIRVGYYGAGTLNILDGAAVTNDSAYIGDQVGSSGIVNVVGAGSQWFINSGYGLHVGRNGNGTLNVLDGGFVDNDDGYIGDQLGTSGIVTVGGAGSQWRNRNLRIGNDGGGTLVIHSGGLVRNRDTYLAYDSSVNGITTVSGVGSLLESTGDLYVGYRGMGLLRIESNAQVDTRHNTWVGRSASANGSIHFTGATLNTGALLTSPAELRGTGTINTSTIVSDIDLIFNSTNGLQQQFVFDTLPGQNILVNIDASDQIANQTLSLGAGYRGDGSITVTDGHSIFSGDGILAHHQPSFAVGTISGPGSRWDTSNMYVANSGTAELIIQDQGQGNASQGYIGHESLGRGTMIVTGDGSQWLSTWLYVGYDGRGTLNIQDGGLVTSKFTYLARNGVSSMGTVSITGHNSLWEITDGVIVGDSGTGIIDHDDGTVRITGGHLTLAERFSSRGFYNLNGGTLDLQNFWIEHGDGLEYQFNFSGGRLENVRLIDLGAPWAQDGGVLAPGGPIGQMDIIHGYDLNAGTVEIGIGGVGNLHDRLTSTGDIDIALTGTTLDLPALGAMAAGTYTVIESTGGTITGTFENITGLGTHPGLIDVNYITNAVTVTLNWDYLPGDLNADGFVGIDDLNIILSNWNQNVTSGDILAGDLNGDGYVGIEDLNAVLGNWNAGTPPPPPDISAAIPEPGTISILALSFLVNVVRRRTCLS